MDTFARVKERLSETYSDYETKAEKRKGQDFFIIVNPFYDENIEICIENGGIIFLFAYQHAHFDYCEDMDDNIDDLIDYINRFIHDDEVSFEFFDEETALFGGSRQLKDIDTSSGESLLKSFARDGDEKEFNEELYEMLFDHLKGVNCRCAIRGWDSKNNKDIDFIL